MSVSLTIIALATSACQQAGDNAAAPANLSANVAESANGVAAADPAPAAPAAPAPAPAAPEPQTGPLALPGDAALPAPCQDYVRLVQACLDRQQGDPTTDARASFVNDTLRTIVRSRRQTWAQAADETYRARICTGDLEGFPQYRRTMRIEC